MREKEIRQSEIEGKRNRQTLRQEQETRLWDNTVGDKQRLSEEEEDRDWVNKRLTGVG